MTLTPRLSRPQLTAYLDWGLVYDQDPAEVAARLAQRGIREVHLSSWYSVDRTRYFFEPFIRACHMHGVLVFSWLIVFMRNQGTSTASPATE